MKLDWNRKYTTISVYALIVVSLSIVFYHAMGNINQINLKLGWIMSTLQPFIIGFVIAYLLNFILVFVEKNMNRIDKYNNLGRKSKRGIGIAITYAIAAFMIYLFVLFVLPQLIDSISGLVNDIPTYVANATKWVEELSRSIEMNNEYVGMALEKWNEFINTMANIITNLIPLIGNAIKDIASSIWNIFIGLIISVYMLIDKENFMALGKKLSYSIFSNNNAEKIVTLANRINTTFGRFLSGKIIDSTIIGILTFVILIVFKMPYALLVSIIIGITNIIPFFGPFIGAVPAFIIIMFVSPVKALWFLVIIFLVQQLDGNIIGPKILGDSIGISAFWILFAILVAGKLLGLVGMIIGVPLFAVIYSLIKEVVESKLDKKGLPTDTEDYM